MQLLILISIISQIVIDKKYDHSAEEPKNGTAGGPHDILLISNANHQYGMTLKEWSN